MLLQHVIIWLERRQNGNLHSVELDGAAHKHHQIWFIYGLNVGSDHTILVLEGDRCHSSHIEESAAFELNYASTVSATTLREDADGWECTFSFD